MGAEKERDWRREAAYYIRGAALLIYARRGQKCYNGRANDYMICDPLKTPYPGSSGGGFN